IYFHWLGHTHHHRGTLRGTGIDLFQGLLRMRRNLRRGQRRKIDQLTQMAMPFRYADRAALYRADHRQFFWMPAVAFEDAAREAASFDRLSYIQYVDYQTYLPYDILTKVDIASMAHGLEVRPPLVDRHVVDVARRLPADERMTYDDRLQRSGKRQIKRMLEAELGSEFVNRRKKGFSAPVDVWLGRDRPLRALLDSATRRDGALAEWFNVEAMQRVVARSDAGDCPSAILWP